MITGSNSILTEEPAKNTDALRRERPRVSLWLARLRRAVSVLLVFVLTWVVLDRLAVVVWPTLVTGSLGTAQDFYRTPVPFTGFKGQPLALDHDENGYRRSDECGSERINIAFFGGSTGYQGEPPIPDLLGEALEERLETTVSVVNFSVVSSNHRQHLHDLIETRSLCQPDLVLFYGGYNELGQPVYYDPRPNYPFNFYFLSETNPLLQWLARQSPTFNILLRLGSVTGRFSLDSLERARESVAYGSEEWQAELSDAYEETMLLARTQVERSVGEGCLRPATFRFVYQPYQVPEEVQNAHQQVRSFARSESFGYDISGLSPLLEPEFTDVVHVTQQGREFIAETIISIILSDDELMANLESCAGDISHSR